MKSKALRELNQRKAEQLQAAKRRLGELDWKEVKIFCWCFYRLAINFLKQTTILSIQHNLNYHSITKIYRLKPSLQPSHSNVELLTLITSPAT
jgi:uncharacterized iron-regulated protein